MAEIGVLEPPLNHAPDITTHTTMASVLPHVRGDHGYGHADYIHHHHYGWKENKKGPQAALNALTLLAFLFFLHILQSCLRDATLASQLPTMLVMTDTSSSSLGRAKREAAGGDTTPVPWTNQEIAELVHNQVQSYWRNQEARIGAIRDPNDVTRIYSFINQSLLQNTTCPMTSKRQSTSKN